MQLRLCGRSTLHAEPGQVESIHLLCVHAMQLRLCGRSTLHAEPGQVESIHLLCVHALQLRLVVVVARCMQSLARLSLSTYIAANSVTLRCCNKDDSIASAVPSRCAVFCVCIAWVHVRGGEESGRRMSEPSLWLCELCALCHLSCPSLYFLYLYLTFFTFCLSLFLLYLLQQQMPLTHTLGRCC
jgi:hypothetical protein